VALASLLIKGQFGFYRIEGHFVTITVVAIYPAAFEDLKAILTQQLLTRGGSVELNRFRAFCKWFSALIAPLPL
jgi:hypothetical protein